jgi:ketosteroid isomerase-like protein
MSHLDEMKSRYKQFDDGDVAGATESWADDMVWEGGNPDVPGGGRHEGKDAVMQVLGTAVGAWDEFRLHMTEFFEDGDRVVVLGHSHVKKGDQSADLPVVHAWTWEGDQIKHLQIITDSYSGAKLLGI